MTIHTRHPIGALLTLATALAAASALADDPPFARIDGEGPGWIALGPDHFADVNNEPDTWTWSKIEADDGEGGRAGNFRVQGTGLPVGVLKTAKPYTNFELSADWRHLSPGGNSGFFVWTPPEVLQDLPPGQLPGAGIEVQVLDHAYTEQYEKSSGQKATWFTTNGDIFAVGRSKLTPFEPLSPDGSRSFPRENRSKGTPEWNHYYVRAINGEIRLWVNGVEVSGGTGADPRTGHLCLEAEGAPVEFRNIRIRELP